MLGSSSLSESDESDMAYDLLVVQALLKTDDGLTYYVVQVAVLTVLRDAFVTFVTALPENHT